MRGLTRRIALKLLLASGLLMGAIAAHATDVAYSGVFIGSEGNASSTGSAVSSNFTRDFNTTGDRVALQVVSSSYSVVVSTSFAANNYVLNTPTITITTNRFTTGLAVLYSTGAVAISGLTNQTTYFVSLVNANTLGLSNSFKLSSSLTNAVAGTGIVLASSSTVANRYTLAPLAFTNVNGGIQLQASNDGNNFVNVTAGNYAATISSVTFAGAGGNVLWDLGPIQYRYLRIKETPPATGGMNYTVISNERYSVQH